MANFCGSCGQKLTSAQYCQNCGAAQNPETESANDSKTISQMTVGEIGQTIKTNVQAMQVEAADEDNATINVGGNNVRIGTIIKIIGVALCFFFFLPLFTVSCAGETISFSGFNSTFGRTIAIGGGFWGGSERLSGNFLSVLILLVPAALFSIFQFKKNISFVQGKLFKTSLALSVCGLIVLIIFALVVSNRVSGESGGTLRVSFTFWYYFSVVLYIISSAISYWCFKTTNKTTSQDSDPTQGSENT